MPTKRETYGFYFERGESAIFNGCLVTIEQRGIDTAANQRLYKFQGAERWYPERRVKKLHQPAEMTYNELLNGLRAGTLKPWRG